MFYYYDKTWIFDQSERAEGPVYIIINNFKHFKKANAAALLNSTLVISKFGTVI